jgi:ADP-ribosylglycohydrolase
VPPAIQAFLESNDFEEAIRKAVSLGGDSDTIACIAGGIAHAYYGPLPEWIERELFIRLDDRMEATIDRFAKRFPGALP